MKRSWLARLAFSFLIIGTFLAWEGYKCWKRGAVNIGLLYLIAAMVSFVMFVVGTKERHRNENQ